MIKKQSNKIYLKKTKKEIMKRSLPILRPARLKSEAHKRILKNKN